MSLSKFFPCFQFRAEDNINKLDYSNNIFTEGFPHVWQYERTLEELNITSTRINYLPPQLFYCQGIKVLLANNNNLENIPEALASLRQLQQLNLSRNFISSVPDNIKSCKNLTHLDLSCNPLQKLPDAITCLISLQEVILNETYLEFLPANFGRLVNLRIVELRSNNLVSLPKSMQRLVNLQRLDIGSNEFTKMPEVIGELKRLRELWFDFNQIETLPVQIGKLRDLEHFEANGNCLNYLPNEIGNLVNIEVLSMSMNNLTTFPFNIGMLKSLVTLKCESNELTELPACISNLENLEEIAVSHNKLVYLPNTLGMLKKLRYLFADNNNLLKIPDEMCSCSQLTVVSVSQNKLSCLPDNLGHLINLKVLNIVQNNIATLPISLLNLVNLTSLWISNNQSQPLIPLQYTEISKKTHLTCFMLPQLITTQKSDTLSSSGCKDLKNESQIEQLTDKAECSAIKRRICFAEETTILQADPQSIYLTRPSYRENGNYCAIAHDNSGSKTPMDFCGNMEIKDEIMHTKNFLMRSPTPYPKQLRLMAKYAQLNHQKSLYSCNSDNYEDRVSVSLLEIKDDVLQEERNPSFSIYTAHMLDESNCSNKNISYSKCGDNREDLDHYTQQKHEQNVEEINNKIQKEVVTNLNLEIGTNISPKPPPYHIARCFTKKSAEDLTKYEFTRKQQERDYAQNCYPCIDDSLRQESDLRNCIMSNNNIKLEYKNNLIIQNTEKNDSKCHTAVDMEKSSDAVPTVGERQLLKHPDCPERSFSSTKRKYNKSRTKWLFGVHKNPRVIQVNVNWESGRDFEIDTVSNKEGIFVVSTVSGSNASQLIHPLDKLLEVEGVDFTNLSINKARQVLQISRPSLSIMLSRK